MDIYVKPMKKATIVVKRQVYIEDVAEVVAKADVANRVKKIKLIDIKDTKKSNYLVTISDIVKLIRNVYPDYTVNNIGEMDTLVEYLPKHHKDNKIIVFSKVAFISLILFTGAITAIMSFHTDSQLARVFANMYEIFFNKENLNPLIIEIPYTIGLSLGIIIFFNHFMGKKVTEDPTPIEVQMTLYDMEVSETIVDILDIQRTKKEDGANGDN